MRIKTNKNRVLIKKAGLFLASRTERYKILRAKLGFWLMYWYNDILSNWEFSTCSTGAFRQIKQVTLAEEILRTLEGWLHKPVAHQSQTWRMNKTERIYWCVCRGNMQATKNPNSLFSADVGLVWFQPHVCDSSPLWNNPAETSCWSLQDPTWYRGGILIWVTSNDRGCK